MTNSPNVEPKPELLAVSLKRRIAAVRMVLGMPTLQTRLCDRDGEFSPSSLFNDIEAALDTRPTPAAVGDVEGASIFDLLEGVAERLRGVDDEQRTDLQAGFARGTGGVDLPYLIDKIAAALAQPQVSGGVDEARALLAADAAMLKRWKEFVRRSTVSFYPSYTKDAQRLLDLAERALSNPPAERR